jgi:hypothetical protein
VKFRFSFSIPQRRSIIQKVEDHSYSSDRSKQVKVENPNPKKNIEIVNLDFYTGSKHHENTKEFDKSDAHITNIKRKFVKLEEEISNTKSKQDTNFSPINKDIITNRILSAKIQPQKQILDDNTDKKIAHDHPLGNILMASGSVIKVSPFKISLIFCIIQILDVILYKIYLLQLILPQLYNGYSFGTNNVALHLVIFHLVYTFLLPFSNRMVMKYSINVENNLFLFKVLMIGAFVFSLSFLFVSYIAFDLKLWVSIILLALRNICLVGVLSCYNMNIIKITNNEFKDKINCYQNYICNIIRAVFEFGTIVGFVYLKEMIHIFYLSVALIMIILFVISIRLFLLLIKIIS